MSRADEALWDEKWANWDRFPESSRLLRRAASVLSGGIALDVACGPGHNALSLAARGYKALGVDISQEALCWGMEQVREAGLVSRVLLAQVDLDSWRPPASTFDLICVFRYLNRELMPALLAALRPGGILIYHTYHVGRLAFRPDATRSFLLLQGELQEWTAGFDILHEEEDLEMAGIVARKTEASSER